VSHASDDELRVMHAVRTLGYADGPRIAARLLTSEHDVSEHLLDFQARGWVTRSSYAGSGGWSLTDAGKAQGERMLAEELDSVGARPAVAAAYEAFLPLNELVARTCTAWQLTGNPSSADVTVAELQPAADGWASIEHGLTGQLERFRGYHDRFVAALTRARSDPDWITGVDRDSAHRVWFELHEDLIATLGLSR
jgi:hypothetical protein